MSHTFKKWLSLILVLISLSAAQAAQRVEKAEQADVQVIVSGSEKNRIVVEGRGISTVMPGQDGILKIEKDEHNRAIFVSFGNELGITQKAAITMFVTDDEGVTYKLVLVQRPVTAEEIILVPPVASLKKMNQGGTTTDVASNHDRQAKALLLQMRNYNENSGVDYKTVDQTVNLWQEAKFVLRGLYYDASLVGEKYVITNVSRNNMVMAEQEFFRTGVVAISVEPKALNPGEEATVYVIRERKNNE